MDERKAIFTVSQCFNSSSIIRWQKKIFTVSRNNNNNLCCANSIYKYAQLGITELDNGSVPTNSELNKIKKMDQARLLAVFLSFFLFSFFFFFQYSSEKSKA